MNPSFYAAKEALSLTLRGRKEPISKDFMRKKGRDLYEQYVHLHPQVIMPLSRFTNLSTVVNFGDKLQTVFFCNLHILNVARIDLVRVFDAILTSRRTFEKLQLL